MTDKVIEKRTIVREEPSGAGVRAISIVYVILDIFIGLLLVRFVLKLLAANPDNSFVGFIYALTEPLVAPFRGVFDVIVESGMIFEWSTLIAMAVYALIAYIVVRIIRAAS